ncbi:MAG: hypothetical protein HY735_25520 [Verrucomicrobia bacterium]|nr:hypothetical protein [Verrucomicrobiota bacterium]
MPCSARILAGLFALQTPLFCAPSQGTEPKLSTLGVEAGGVGLIQTSDNKIRVSNHYVTLLIRSGEPGAECQYRLGEQTVQGPLLRPAAGAGDGAKTITAIRVTENNAERALFEVKSVTQSGKQIVTFYLVRKNTPIIEVQPGEGMERLRVEAASRYAVVPDIFAGDLIINPATTAEPSLRLPSENLLLQLAVGGNAIIACAWRSGQQAVRLTLDGGGDGRATTGTEIDCRGVFPVSVAILAAPGIWQQKKIAELDPVKDVKLDGKVPFRALWRADYRRADGLIDSWKCLLREGRDHYEGFGIDANKARTVWTSARGTFAYPASIDGDSCFLRKTRFEGAPEIRYDDNQFVVIYPHQAVRGSPAGTFGGLDILRATLRETPEASLLENLEIKRVPRDRWPATCAVTADYEEIFDAGEEKAKKALVSRRLEEMNNFVINIRSRMNEYLAWQKKTREFVAKTKAEKPQLAALADEFDGILATFGKIYERRKLDERTPAAAHALIENVLALIDSAEANKDEKAKQIGRDTRIIGGNQDSCIGEFRMSTKRLRQRAGYRMAEAQDDTAFEFAREVRQRTMEMLQEAFQHESAQTD